uniref:Pentatricopeptide repeat containing protein n=1 Tax=Volvariella volvacea TaxID=36659 RepID=H6VLD1_9AGAR|nr:pentatricopeptide repeat containing protein [Volvariella volvacea]
MSLRLRPPALRLPPRPRPLPALPRSSSTVARHDHPARLASLLDKVSSRAPLAIHTHYPALVDEVKLLRASSPGSQPPVARPQVVELLETLAASARPPDLQRIDQILDELTPVFGIEPSIDIYSAIITQLVKRAGPQTVLRWLQSMPTRPGHFSPTLEHYHLFLEAILRSPSPSFKFMRNLVLTMRNAGCKPTNETFIILIRARWILAAQEEKVPHLIVFNTLLDDMKREGLRFNAEIAQLLYEGYANQGMIAYADQIEATYRAQFPDDHTPVHEKVDTWSLRISRIAQSHGIKAAISQFRSLSKQGCQLTPPIVKAIIRHSRNLNDLNVLRTELGIEPTVAHYSILISNSTRTGHVQEAIKIYEDARAAGIQPDAGLVAPLIKALCRAAAKPPTDAALDQALSFYHHLVESTPIEPSTDKTSYNEHSVGPDANIYQNLLRGLASSPNNTKYLPVARSLLNDMEARGISPTDSITASSIVVLLMKQASDRGEALSIYRKLSSALDEKGYAIVLNAFCKLSFGDHTHAQIPSLTEYFGIVKDMRRRNLPITAEVYTIILHQIASIATQLKFDDDEETIRFRDHLITTTRRTHDLLTLDASISPDAHLFNQLMDTYQRLGCFGDSYRVWDMMYLSGRFDHISVSIILDACGYAKAWQLAKQICTKLFNDGFRFSLHNWNTWLECLCRVGRLNDAVRTACIDMIKAGQSDGIRPNVESARILLKFARKANQEDEVLSRLKDYLPELWASLPEDLRNGRV